MAYGVKYFCKVAGFNGGKSYRIDLLQNGYASSSTEIIEASDRPLQKKVRGGKTVKDDVIIGGELEFQFLVNKTDDYSDILDSNYKDWKAIVYDITGVETQIWEGWLKPELSDKIFIEDQTYVLSLSFVDGLADLKDIEYAPATDGHVSQLTIIKECLNNTGIDLDFQIQVNSYPSEISPGACPIALLTANTKRWKKNKDGYDYYENCYDVLTDLLKPYNAQLVQENGVYLITNHLEKDSTLHLYGWDLISDGSLANNLVLDISSYSFRSNGNVERIAPVKRLELTFQNKNLGEDIIPENWTFNNEWVGTDQNNEGTYLYGDYDEGEIVSPTTFTITSDSFYVAKLTDNDVVNFSFRVKNSNLIGANSLPLTVQYKPSSGNWTSAVVDRLVYDFETTVSISIPIEVSDNYQVRFSITPEVGVEVFVIEFFDITGVTVYDGANTISTDTLIIGDSSVSAVNKEEDVIVFGDTAQENDIAVFKYGGSNVSSWNRYDASLGYTLQELYLKSYLTNYSKFKDYAKIEIEDYDDTITYNDVLTIGGKYYKWVSYTKDYMFGTVKGDLIEIITNDVSVNLIQNTLNSVDGESTTSTKTVTVDNTSVINDAIVSFNYAYSSSKVQDLVSNLPSPSLQEVTDEGNSTNNSIILNEVSLYGDASGNLIVGGDVHVMGDIVAYSSLTPPATSWFESLLPGYVDNTTIEFSGGTLTVIGGVGSGITDASVINIVNNNTSIDAYNAERLDGQDSTYYTNIPARLGYTPYNAASVPYGFGATSQSGTAIDVNTVDTNGAMYFLNNSATNVPIAGSYWHLLHFGNGDNSQRGAQLLLNYQNGGHLYVRNRHSTDGAWHRIWNEKNSNLSTTDWNVKDLYVYNDIIMRDSHSIKIYDATETDRRLSINTTENYARIYYYDESATANYDLKLGSHNIDVGIYWDAANSRAGINTDSPTHTLDVNGDLKTTLINTNNLTISKDVDDVFVNLNVPTNGSIDFTGIRMGYATTGFHSWLLKYIGTTGGDGGNEIRVESEMTGNYYQFDHEGNFEISSGTLDVNGNIRAATNYISSTIWTAIGSEGTGSIYIRPSGYASSTNQSSFTTSLVNIGTDLKTTGNLYVDYTHINLWGENLKIYRTYEDYTNILNFYAQDSNNQGGFKFISHRVDTVNTKEMMYISGDNDKIYHYADVEVNGTITSTSTIFADTYFASSDNAAVIGTTNSGTIYIRPADYASSTNQTSFTTSLSTIGTNLQVNGELLTIGSTSTNNEAGIVIDATNAGSPQIGFSEHGDMSWAIGGDDSDNSFKIHGSATATIPTINNLVYPHFEITTAGVTHLRGDVFLYNGATPATSFFMDVNTGNFHADGDIIAYSTSTSSDRRLKENIEDTSYGLYEILKLNPVKYKFKKKEGEHLGLIAQDVEKVIPEIVNENKSLNDEESYKTLKYDELIPVLINAIKEQQQEINKLKERLDGR